MKVIKDERLGVKLEYGISYFEKRKKSKDLKAIKENLKNQKWVFVLAKHGLKVGIKISYILVSQKREKRERRAKGENKRKRKRKKRKKRREEKPN